MTDHNHTTESCTLDCYEGTNTIVEIHPDFFKSLDAKVLCPVCSKYEKV